MRNFLICAALIAAAMFGPFVWARYTESQRPPVAAIPSGDRAAPRENAAGETPQQSPGATLDDVEPPAKNPLIDGLRRMLDDSPAFEEHGDELREQLSEADTLLAKIKDENRAALASLRKGPATRRRTAMRGKPNLIVIDLGRLAIDALSCYHDEAEATEVFDHLADQGVLFKRFYRSSLDPAVERERFLFANAGWKETPNADSVDDSQTLPNRLKENGYHSAIIGHTRFAGAEPNTVGFDAWFGAQSDDLARTAWPESVWADGAELKLVIDDQERFDAQMIYMTEAFAFAKRSQQSQPFFLWLSLPFPDSQFPSTHSGTDVMPKGQQLERLQQQLVEWIRELNDRRIANNSVVVLTSLTPPRVTEGEDPLSQRRVQAPLIVLAPGRVKKTINQTLCTSADLAATLADFAGLTSDRSEANSLMSELTEQRPAASNQKSVVWRSGEHEVVVFDNWRCERVSGETTALFDLDSAEGLSKNVAGLHPQVVVRAKHLLHQASP